MVGVRVCIGLPVGVWWSSYICMCVVAFCALRGGAVVCVCLSDGEQQPVSCPRHCRCITTHTEFDVGGFVTATVSVLFSALPSKPDTRYLLMILRSLLGPSPLSTPVPSDLPILIIPLQKNHLLKTSRSNSADPPTPQATSPPRPRLLPRTHLPPPRHSPRRHRHNPNPHRHHHHHPTPTPARSPPCSRSRTPSLPLSYSSSSSYPPHHHHPPCPAPAARRTPPPTARPAAAARSPRSRPAAAAGLAVGWRGRAMGRCWLRCRCRRRFRFRSRLGGRTRRAGRRYRLC